MTRFCDIDGCDREHAAKGMCDMHYLRVKRGGDAGPAQVVKRVPSRGITLADHLWSIVDRSAGADGCWLFLGDTASGGYGRFTHSGRRLLAHRAAWEVTHGTIPAGMQVRHLVCDNPPCCNPAHLELGTPAENSHDKMRAGRRSRSAALTSDQVLAIREATAAGEPQRSIADRFAISQVQVWRIVRGHDWKDVAA